MGYARLRALRLAAAQCSARKNGHSVKGISAVSASEKSRKQALFDGRQPSRDLKKAYPNAILPRGTSNLEMSLKSRTSRCPVQ
jgi:hypothetical protein